MPTTAGIKKTFRKYTSHWIKVHQVLLEVSLCQVKKNLLFQKELHTVEQALLKNNHADEKRKAQWNNAQLAKKKKILANMELLNKITPDITLEELRNKTKEERARIKQARIAR